MMPKKTALVVSASDEKKRKKKKKLCNVYIGRTKKYKLNTINCNCLCL